MSRQLEIQARKDAIRQRLNWLREHPYAAGTEGEADSLCQELDHLQEEELDL